MPLFSIIIPIYNTKKYLYKCIKSVLDQKHKRTEIILIEDCSTDGSLNVCNSFKNNPSINIIRHNKNIGVAKSRNEGILASKGEYILFLDSDDWIYQGCLRGIEKLIVKKPETEVIIGKFNSDGFPSSNNILFKKGNSNTFDGNKFISFINQLNYRPMVIWHYIVKKSLITNKKLNFVDVKNGEDEEFGARLLCFMKSCSLYEKNYYWHRTRKKGGLRYSMDFQSTKSFLKILIEYYKLISKINLSYEKRKFINTCIQFAIGEFSARIVLHNKKEINRLSLNFDKFTINSEISLDKIKDCNFFLLRKNKKSFTDLLLYKEKVTKNVLNKLKNIKFKFNKIYIYCAAVHGISTLLILKKNKFKVTSLIDDNPTLQGQSFMNVGLISGKYFLKKTKQNSSKMLIVVCQQSIKTFNKISNKLKLSGINNNQIVHIMY